MTKLLIRWLDAAYGWLYEDAVSVPGDPQFRYWQDGKWFYSLVSGNNELLAASTQGYANKAAVLRAIEQCRRNATAAVEIRVERAPTE